MQKLLLEFSNLAFFLLFTTIKILRGFFFLYIFIALLAKKNMKLHKVKQQQLFNSLSTYHTSYSQVSIFKIFVYNTIIKCYQNQNFRFLDCAQPKILKP